MAGGDVCKYTPQPDHVYSHFIGFDDDGSRRMAPDYRFIGSTRRLDSWMNSRSLVVEMLA